MSYIKVEKLILVDAKPFEMIDKENGKSLKKIKYEFLQADGTILRGYLSEKDFTYEKEIKMATGWDEKKARKYCFLPKEFEGKTRFQLVTSQERASMLKDLESAE